MHIARPKFRTLHVAELVEYEERMEAGAAEVAVEGRTFLLAVGGAVGAVHVEDQRFESRTLMDPVSPVAREVGQCLAGPSQR